MSRLGQSTSYLSLSFRSRTSLLPLTVVSMPVP
uniref:Uncharacterized protein n=1 Tax=Arundo donax TaxID=35708 RepID=A0A0A9I3C9_ARUDO